MWCLNFHTHILSKLKCRSVSQANAGTIKIGHKRHPPFATSFACSFRSRISFSVSVSFVCHSDTDERLGQKGWEEKQTSQTSVEWSQPHTQRHLLGDTRQASERELPSTRSERYQSNRKTCEWIAYKKAIDIDVTAAHTNALTHSLSRRVAPVCYYTQTYSISRSTHSLVHSGSVLIGRW